MSLPQARFDLGGASSRTAAEITSQPSLWPRALEAGATATRFQERLAAGTTLYVGCGSTAHLARALALAHRQTLATPAWGEAASEVWLTSSALAWCADTVVAVSRSGQTTETIEAAKRASSAGAALVCISTQSDSELHEICGDAVVVDFAAEESVVQTRSFTCMLVAALSAQFAAAGRQSRAELAGMEDLGSALMEDAQQVTGLLADPCFDSIVVLGSGLEWPLACEGALKIKEMSATVAEAFPVLDFRHGPISAVGEGTAILLLCGNSIEHELAVASDAEGFGAQVVTVGPDPRCTIATPHEAPAASIAVARLVISQLAGMERGVAKGIDTDAPAGVAAYVRLHETADSSKESRTWPQ